jgi:hypothetical protein
MATSNQEIQLLTRCLFTVAGNQYSNATIPIHKIEFI